MGGSPEATRLAPDVPFSPSAVQRTPTKEDAVNETREQNPVRVEQNGSQAPSTPSMASMVEEGSAFMHLTGGSVAEKETVRMGHVVEGASTAVRGEATAARSERVEVVVIG